MYLHSGRIVIRSSFNTVPSIAVKLASARSGFLMSAEGRKQELQYNELQNLE